jgi:hypothetical protein
MKRSKSASERLGRHDFSPRSGARHSSLGPLSDRHSEPRVASHSWEDSGDLLRRSTVLDFPRHAIDYGSQPGTSVVADQDAFLLKTLRPVTCKDDNVAVDNDAHDGMFWHLLVHARANSLKQLQQPSSQMLRRKPNLSYRLHQHLQPAAAAQLHPQHIQLRDHLDATPPGRS